MVYIQSDPNKIPEAKRLDKVSYEEMLEMASLGAKVLQTRSVETAMTNNVALRVYQVLKAKIKKIWHHR